MAFKIHGTALGFSLVVSNSTSWLIDPCSDHVISKLPFPLRSHMPVSRRPRQGATSSVSQRNNSPHLNETIFRRPEKSHTHLRRVTIPPFCIGIRGKWRNSESDYPHTDYSPYLRSSSSAFLHQASINKSPIEMVRLRSLSTRVWGSTFSQS